MQSNYGAIPELPCAVPELYRGNSGIVQILILRLTYTLLMGCWCAQVQRWLVTCWHRIDVQLRPQCCHSPTLVPKSSQRKALVTATMTLNLDFAGFR